jgi:hypothetical protein
MEMTLETGFVKRSCLIHRNIGEEGLLSPILMHDDGGHGDCYGFHHRTKQEHISKYEVIHKI